MKTLSLVSCAIKTETADDRRRAIQSAWSQKEMSIRHQNAIDSQFRLADLILMGPQKKRQVREVLELAS